MVTIAALILGGAVLIACLFGIGALVISQRLSRQEKRRADAWNALTETYEEKV